MREKEAKIAKTQATDKKNVEAKAAAEAAEAARLQAAANEEEERRAAEAKAAAEAAESARIQAAAKDEEDRRAAEAKAAAEAAEAARIQAAEKEEAEDAISESVTDNYDVEVKEEAKIDEKQKASQFEANANATVEAASISINVTRTTILPGIEDSNFRAKVENTASNQSVVLENEDIPEKIKKNVTLSKEEGDNDGNDEDAGNGEVLKKISAAPLRKEDFIAFSAKVDKDLINDSVRKLEESDAMQSIMRQRKALQARREDDAFKAMRKEVLSSLSEPGEDDIDVSDHLKSFTAAFLRKDEDKTSSAVDAKDEGGDKNIAEAGNPQKIDASTGDDDIWDDLLNDSNSEVHSNERSDA